MWLLQPSCMATSAYEKLQLTMWDRLVPLMPGTTAESFPGNENFSPGGSWH